MRTIDADWLKERINGDDVDEPLTIYGVEYYIDQAPTIDLWYYPSKGELPPMDTRVYLWTKGDVFPVVARRHDFHRSNEEWSWDCYWGSGFEIKANADCIIAWQYIIPPQEEA